MIDDLYKITNKRKLMAMQRDNEMYSSLVKSLSAFKQLRVAGNDTIDDIFSEVRAMFMPYLKEKFMQDANTNMVYELFDPSYLNVVDRAVSGIQSYHIPPNDKFFKLSSLEFGKNAKEPVDTDLEAALAMREEEIHNIIQFPENYIAETAIQRDKFLFGFCGKVIDSDETLVSRITHYPPEAVMIGSSTGKYFDIYGVCEALSWQQIRKRYPKPLTSTIYEMRDFKFGNSETEMVYRMNIPKQVLIDHVKACYMDEDMREFEAFLNKALGGKKNENWVDIHFTDDAILSINVQSYRNIMVPTFAPGADQTDLSKGVGERSVPLVVLMSELEIILLTGAERTYAPAWMVSNEVQANALKLGRNEITFGEAEDSIQNLGLNADIRGMVELKEYKNRVLERMMFLDVFELIQKNRMPTTEVEMRRSDDFRKLGLFLTADEMTNLNPTVLLINAMIHERAKTKSAIGNRVLKAVYSSPIAFSHRNTEVDKAGQLFNLIGVAKTLDAEDSPLNDYFDFGNYLKSIVSHLGIHNLIRPKEEASARANQRNERTRVADLREQTDALHKSNELRDQAEQRRVQGAQDGGATAGGRGPEAPPQGPQSAVLTDYSKPKTVRLS